MSELDGLRKSAPGQTETAAAEEPLRRAGVPYQLAPLVEGAQSLDEFARLSGLRSGQVLKTLLLSIDSARYALLLVAGDRTADFAALRRHFGARSVRLADREVVEQVTGYRIGMVTPLGVRTAGLPIVFDDVALTEPVVSLGTGRPGRHVRLAPGDLMRALGAQPGPFSRPERQRA